MADSRIGFEASNQYYYIPLDLAEKIVNCDQLLTRVVARATRPLERPKRTSALIT